MELLEAIKEFLKIQALKETLRIHERGIGTATTDGIRIQNLLDTIKKTEYSERVTPEMTQDYNDFGH